MAVYLLHFAEPYFHARHYLGFTDDADHDTDASIASRLDYHMRGKGNPLVRAVANAGIEITVARTWPQADRNFERWLKRGRRARKLCPECAGARAYLLAHYNGQKPPAWTNGAQ